MSMMTPDKTKEVFDSLDLAALPENEQEEVLLTMGELIFKDSLMRCIEAMTPEDRSEFAKLADSDASADEIAEFVVARVPDADALVAAAMNELSDDILAVTKQ